MIPNTRTISTQTMRKALLLAGIIMFSALPAHATVQFQQVCGVRYNASVWGPRGERKWRLTRINDGLPRVELLTSDGRIRRNWIGEKAAWPINTFGIRHNAGSKDAISMREENAQGWFKRYGVKNPPLLATYAERGC